MIFSWRSLVPERSRLVGTVSQSHIFTLQSKRIQNMSLIQIIKAMFGSIWPIVITTSWNFCGIPIVFSRNTETSIARTTCLRIFVCLYFVFRNLNPFLKSPVPVNNDQKGHDNVQLASVLVLLENRNTSVHFLPS